MLNISKSIYVTVYRWSFKNFGQGELPRFKSLFNVSFLLIILLTNAMILTQLVLKSQLFTINVFTGTVILLGAVFFLLLNHLVFLNNRWLKQLNYRLANLSRHNLNTWSVFVLINVIIICCFLIVIAR
jgi:hypothetical protein